MNKYIVTANKYNKKLKYLNTGIKFAIPITKVLIIRGIGYRAFVIENDFLSKTILSETFAESKRPVYTGIRPLRNNENTDTTFWEFSKKKYLIVRAGHTRDLCVPITKITKCQVNKKDRKLTIASTNAALSKNLAMRVYSYRTPSAYTGRGVRSKNEKPIRKAGKKDKQRGRAF